MLVVAAKHGLQPELPVWSASGVREQVDAVKRLARESDDALGEKSARVSNWAVQQVSYSAFQEQFKKVLKVIW